MVWNCEILHSSLRGSQIYIQAQQLRKHTVHLLNSQTQPDADIPDKRIIKKMMWPKKKVWLNTNSLAKTWKKKEKSWDQ